jgi:Sulfatase
MNRDTKLSRRALLQSAALTVVQLRAQSQRPPNIILILADDLGYADLGCYGNTHIRMPHTDRIAAEGVRFTDFTVSWPACTPSRGSILTGRYPQRNGLYDMIRNNEVNWKYQFDEQNYALSPEMTLGLDTREVTIGQAMRSADYATAVVGKWDSGRASRFLPTQRAASTHSTASPTPASITTPMSATAFRRCSATTIGSRKKATPPTCSAVRLCDLSRSIAAARRWSMITTTFSTGGILWNAAFPSRGVSLNVDVPSCLRRLESVGVAKSQASSANAGPMIMLFSISETFNARS